jgi:hypothetical protein
LAKTYWKAAETQCGVSAVFFHLGEWWNCDVRIDGKGRHEFALAQYRLLAGDSAGEDTLEAISKMSISDNVGYRTDALLDYARTAFDTEHTRCEFAEVKAARYLTIVGIFAAANAYRLPDVARIVHHIESRAAIAFVAAYASGAFCAVISVYRCLEAMRTEELPHAAIEDDMVGIFVNTPREIILQGLSQRLLESARVIRGVNRRRFDSLDAATRWLIRLIAAALITLITYTALPENLIMSDATKPNATASPPVAMPIGTATLPSTNPIPKFQLLKESDIGTQKGRLHE